MNTNTKPSSPWYHAIPNQITLFRVVSVPLFLALASFDGRVFKLFAAALFLISALSDWLDGFLARLWKVESRLGAILDPLADKIAIAAALVVVAAKYPQWAPIFAILLARDIGITGLRMVALERGVTVSVNAFGKIKTILIDTCLVCLLVGEDLFGWPWMLVGNISMVLSVAVSLYSAWLYWRVFAEQADI